MGGDAKASGAFRAGTRGSFSAAVTPEALALAQTGIKSAARQMKDDKVALQLEELKKSLARKYGSLSAAWRLMMDPGHHGKLSFAEWSTVLREHGFEGDIRAAYKLLDDDSSG